MTSKSLVNWRAGETEYKFSLKTQIDRVAQMFSQRLETSSANLAVAETILVDTCVKSVNTLEAMLPFQDDVYKKEMAALGPTPAGLKEINNWCMKKFALIMFLMKRKRLLLEEVEDEIEEGAPDEIEFGSPGDEIVKRPPGRPPDVQGAYVA